MTNNQSNDKKKKYGMLNSATKVAMALSLLIAGGPAANLMVNGETNILGIQQADAANAETDFVTEVLGDGVIISGYSGTSKDVVIPATIGGKNVVGIKNFAFSTKSLTSVVFPDTLKTIGTYAFYRNSLTTVSIPSGVEIIEVSAFEQNQLTNVTFAEGLKTIGMTSFRNNKILSLNIPNSVTEIAAGAFSGNQLTELAIPENVKIIQAGAFGFNQLTSLTLSYGLETLGQTAFSSNKLTEVTIPGSVNVIEDSAFASNQLETIDIGHGVKTIGMYAFDKNRLTKVTIPNSVTYIAAYAFRNNKIEQAVIPGSVTVFAHHLFQTNQTVSTDVIIYGDPGSKAQTYAQSYSHTFIDMKYLPATLEEATASVVTAETVRTQEVVDAARSRVDTLEESPEKVSLSARLDIVQDEIDTMTMTVAAVEKAEQSKLQADVDAARTLVNNMPSGTDKFGLLSRLDAVQAIIDLQNATQSVTQAESSKLQADVNTARSLVNALPTSTAKTSLTTRLNTVQSGIDAINAATASVVKAEGSKLQADVTAARTLVNALPSSTTKTNLTTRLNTVQTAIDAAIALQNQINAATDSVVTAETAQTQSNVNAARTLVNALPTSTTKTNLTTRLDTVQSGIDTITAATASVVKAEGSKLQADVTAARTLVNNLPASATKTSLTSRLDTVQTAIDAEIALQNQINTATASVLKAEGSKLQADVTAARTLVNALPTSTTKTSLTMRLNTVQTAIDAAIALQNQINTATDSVVTAETAQTQANVNAARTLVNGLPAGSVKTLLGERLDTVQASIDAAIALQNQINAATASVVTAEGSKIQEDVTAARTLVNALPAGSVKILLGERLDTLQASIDAAIALQNQINTATDSVVTAETSKSQADVNTARTLVNALPDGTEKTNLSDRLDILQASVDAALALQQQIAAATTAVTQSESSESQGDVDAARTLVNALPSGPAKISLTERLNTVQDAIEAVLNLQVQIASATSAVMTAEGSESQEDVDTARTLVNALPTGQVKTDLSNRLDVVQASIDAALAIQQQLVQAMTAVTQAEASESQEDVDAARSLVNALPAGPEKINLSNRLDMVQTAIDAALALQQQIAQATTSVTNAETTKSQEDVDAARTLVNALPDGVEKKDLSDRLDTVQVSIDAALALQAQIVQATTAVTQAESSSSQADVDTARTVVDALPDGTEKTNLSTRLDVVQSAIDAALAVQTQIATATNAVTQAEDSESQADTDAARTLVNALPDGPEKNNLLDRLDTVQASIDATIALQQQVAQAISAVTTAEASVSQSDVDTARTLVNGLPSGSDKTALTQRLDDVQSLIDSAASEGEQLLEAIASVEKAEDSQSQVDVDTAYALVNKLSASTEKETLIDRLDTLQDTIDLNLQYQEQITRATDSVVKAENSRSQDDVNEAYDLLTALPDISQKDVLKSRLLDVQMGILSEIAKSVAIAEKLKRDPYFTSSIQRLVEVNDEYEMKGQLLERVEVAMNSIAANNFSTFKSIVGENVEWAETKEEEPYVRALHELSVNTEELAALKAAVEAAETQVAYAERYKRDPYLTRAADFINNIPLGPERDALQARLDVILGGSSDKVEAENLLAATTAVERAEKGESIFLIDDAQLLVNKLKQSENKTSLQVRLDAIEQTEFMLFAYDLLKDIAELGATEQKLFNASFDATKMYGERPSSSYLTKANAALAALAPYELSQADLYERLGQYLTDVKAKIAEDAMFARAENVIALAERYKRQNYIDRAQNEINLLPEGERRDAMQARLDAI